MQPGLAVIDCGGIGFALNVTAGTVSALKLGTNCIGLMFILIACTIVLSMVMFVLFNFLRIPSMVTGLGVLMMY